jgi:hypothetical protein
MELTLTDIYTAITVSSISFIILFGFGLYGILDYLHSILKILENKLIVINVLSSDISDKFEVKTTGELYDGSMKPYDPKSPKEGAD